MNILLFIKFLFNSYYKIYIKNIYNYLNYILVNNILP